MDSDGGFGTTRRGFTFPPPLTCLCSLSPPDVGVSNGLSRGPGGFFEQVECLLGTNPEFFGDLLGRQSGIIHLVLLRLDDPICIFGGRLRGLARAHPTGTMGGQPGEHPQGQPLHLLDLYRRDSPEHLLEASRRSGLL